jgi:hypothetical protein
VHGTLEPDATLGGALEEAQVDGGGVRGIDGDVHALVGRVHAEMRGATAWGGRSHPDIVGERPRSRGTGMFPAGDTDVGASAHGG